MTKNTASGLQDLPEQKTSLFLRLCQRRRKEVKQDFHQVRIEGDGGADALEEGVVASLHLAVVHLLQAVERLEGGVINTFIFVTDTRY